MIGSRKKKEPRIEQIFYTGWKEICHAFGIQSVSTMKKKVKKYKIPIKTMDGKPSIGVEDLQRWHSELDPEEDSFQDGFIYFIQHGTSNGPIKIGFTRNVRGRLKLLQTATPEELKLLVTIDGTILDERKLQKRFKKYHIKNEWFSPGSKLLDFINEISNST